MVKILKRHKLREKNKSLLKIGAVLSEMIIPNRDWAENGIIMLQIGCILTIYIGKRMIFRSLPGCDYEVLPDGCLLSFFRKLPFFKLDTELSTKW